MYWSARPFVRIFFFFAAGIFLFFKIDFFRDTSLFIFPVTIFILLFIAYLLLPKRLPFNWHWIKGVVLAIALMVTGVFVARLHYPLQEMSAQQVKGSFLGIVSNQPSETEKSLKVKVEVVKKLDSLSGKLPGYVLLYFEKDSVNKLHYGDVVLFSATLKTPDGPSNPEEFNYNWFLKARGVSLVGFVPRGSFRIVGNKPPNRLLAFAISLRQKILKALKNNGLSGDEYAVAAAIVLGYDDMMDDAIRQNYQRAGAMHVLCVSGLHVGVIYLVMMTLLQFLNKSKKGKIVKAILLLLSVWMYALLTGLAPSVMRATVMISFIIIGNEVERDKDAYNTLAMSAVFLLLYNPGFLFNVGFQLSYAAVLGIVTFYRPLVRLLYVKNLILRKAWEATAVSLAAQLGAFPVAAHYFHFFPTWFLLSNLIVMVFSTVIISTGMLFAAVSWIPLVSGGVAFVLSGLIYLMNYLIELVGHLPWSGVEDLWFPWFEVAFIYLAVLFAFVFLQKKEPKFIIPFLSTALLLVLFQVGHRYNVLTQHKIIVYNVGKKHSAIDFVNGNNHVLYCDSVLLKEPKGLEYATDNLRIKLGLKKNTRPLPATFSDGKLNLWVSQNIFVFNGMSVALIDDDSFVSGSKPLKVDWVIFSGSRKVDVDKLMQTISFKRVIIEPMGYHKGTEKLISRLSAKGVRVYNVEESGAFVYNF